MKSGAISRTPPPQMSVKEARMELEAEGYRFDGVIDVLPWQHILVFRR